MALLSNIIVAINWLRLRYLDYVPRPTDIFIATYPRSGTTWLQMILYQLSTDGNMEFPHIAQFIPWFERLSNMQTNVEALPSPRIFKTHLAYRRALQTIPKGPCKYIYVVRDGKDVAVSYFYFYKSHLGFQGSFSDFFDRFMRGKVQYGSWFKHVVGWQSQKDKPNVLWLKYEDMLNDLEGSIRKIADFCGFAIEPEKLPAIVQKCSFEFMKQHESKFDHAVEMLWENGITLGEFIRQGQKADWKQNMTSQQQAAFDEEFARHSAL